MRVIKTRFLTSIGVLIIGSSIFTACSRTVDNRTNVSANAVQNKPPANNVESGASKAAENTNTTGTTQTDSVTVYDGRDGVSDASQKQGSAAEKALVEKEFNTNEAAILQKSKMQCDDETQKGVSILASADGAFTKANSKQKAYLYERCRAGRSFGIGGIMVFEDGKVAAHYVYGENGLSSGLLALPDINKNGLSEIELIGADMNQGYGVVSVDLLELTGANTIFLGRTEAHSDNSGAAEDDEKVLSTDYKISVQPAAEPVFLRDTYTQKGEKGKPELTKKAEKFSLDKKEPLTFIKIN